MNNANATSYAAKKQEAFSLFQRNRLPEARKLYNELCHSDGADADACYMLGVICGKFKQFTEAADSFRQAIALQPKMAMAHYGLGTCLKAEGRFVEAVESFRQTVQIKPDHAMAHFELGGLLLRLGNPAGAMENYHAALRLKPTVDGYFSLGNVQFSQGLVMEAVTSYQEALKLDPTRADIHYALGFSCYVLGRHDETVDSCHRAIDLQPDFLKAHNCLGAAYTVLGRIDDAVSSYREALRIKPDFIEAASGIVAAYEWVGDYQRAGEHLLPLIERHPENAGVAISFARLCKRLGRCDEATVLIDNILKRDDLPALDRRQLHFSIGKLYDAMGSWDTAFGHYQSANSIQAPPYDPAQHARSIDTVIATFTADFLRRLPHATPASDRPVFIVGMPRSGSSLVEQILASHPQVYGAGELGDITQLVQSLPGYLDPVAGYPGCLHKLTQDAVNALASRYLDHLEKLSADAMRVTDKMPHNFLHLGMIYLLFPKARVIHCVRDPLDTCLSIYFQYFNASHAYACDLSHIGTHYREYQRLMTHWRQVLELPMLEVRYEDLVTNSDEMIPRLVEFCGLDWEPACLRFYENRRFVNTASYDQVRQPLHPKSIRRWRHYEKHLAPLKILLGAG